MFKFARAIARAIFGINFSRFSKKHHFFMFFGVIFTMKIFVVLKDKNITSKHKMFKIDHSFDL